MVLRAAALAAVLCASCASPTGLKAPRTLSPAGPDAAQVTAGVAAAEADMYANRYSDAGSAFAALLVAAPRSAGVLAADALFRNYEGDGSAALQEATHAVHLDARDADAQAVLCRVDDWAGNIIGAVAAGNAAVALNASNPRGHLFLAEALSDSGETSGAQAQINTAAALIAAHPTAYLTGELQRERANLDADLGENAMALQAFEAALAAQPGWLYRTTEVVNAELIGGDSAAARATLDAAAAQTPDDLRTLESLGNDAMLVSDATATRALWGRALALAPHDPVVLDAAGEVAVAVNHDVNAATADFEQTLRVDPYDPEAAAYLMAIATDIAHDPAAGRAEITAAVLADLPPGDTARRRLPVIPNPAVPVADDATIALAAVNAARHAAGLPPVHLDTRLSASALSHSFYWLFNYFAPGVTGLGIHYETRGHPGYTAVYPWTRAIAFDYPNQRIGEDITHSGAPDSAVADWVNSVFHRFAIMRPDLRVIGYGEATIGSVAMEDMEFGFAVASPAAPVLYPGPGQAHVPATFVDNELPDPVPPGQPRTTGYPVTVTFSAADRVSMRSFTLTSPGGTVLAAYVLAPSASTENSASLLPVTPLVPGAVYTARISATVNGAPYVRSWTFTVAAGPP
jgi:tetratricopeptide (TPR) repeat protein